MDIDSLLNKYFEGETSAGEEKAIRDFFASEEIPERLTAYRPLFAYFDGEIGKTQKPKGKNLPRRLIVWASGIAASLLFMAGLWSVYVGTDAEDPCICMDNYVIINGQCYADVEKARTMALEALFEVATPVTDFLPEDDFFDIDELL